MIVIDAKVIANVGDKVDGDVKLVGHIDVKDKNTRQDSSLIKDPQK